jgi:hypothetical protein
MGAAISDIKALGIDNVGVWFPTTGYWGGFIKGGKDAKALSQYLVETDGKLWDSDYEKQGTLLVSPDKEKAAGYFDELCSRVKSWGADFVKIDNQGFHNYYKDKTPIGKSAKAIQSAIDLSVKKHFNGQIINCMGMPTECMFNRPESAVSRCSDDFIPESREWFAKNIMQSTYNGLLQGRFYVNDFDMWWTDDSCAPKNGLLRAVSGGPIYVSDKIGRTKADVLKPLSFSDGRIPRCDESATPTADCLGSDPVLSDKPLKIRNRMDGVLYVAAFNVNGEGSAVSGETSPSDVCDVNGEYYYYEYYNKTCGVLGEGEGVKFSLSDSDKTALFSFYKKGDGVAPLGRVDMPMGYGAVKNHAGDEFTLYEGGEIGFLSDKTIKVYSGGKELETKREGLLTTAVCVGNKVKIKDEVIK